MIDKEKEFTGVCKFYNFSKKFGFATVDDDEVDYDVFLTDRNVVKGGLSDGVKLRFKIGEGDRGFFAYEIEVLEE